MPLDERVQFATSLTEKIKYQFGSGYEHFVHQGDYATGSSAGRPGPPWRSDASR
ncbi:hypothetical protein [Streptomyces malaysiensis]|uniref:hypothetical protein n=1 Tax=Streptomyces malaysiensis TaxID=92644 RepID=UPI00321FDC7A